MTYETAERYQMLEHILTRLDTLKDDAEEVGAMDVAGAIESAMDEARAAMEMLEQETYAGWAREERQARLDYERAVI